MSCSPLVLVYPQAVTGWQPSQDLCWLPYPSTFHAAKDYSPPHVYCKPCQAFSSEQPCLKLSVDTNSQRVALTCILLHSGSCLGLHNPRRSCDRCNKHNTTPTTFKRAQHNAETHWNSRLKSQFAVRTAITSPRPLKGGASLRTKWQE